MVELAGVVITAAVTLLTTLGWPTLRRRVREHAALVKDLPEKVAGPLIEVLELEVEVLAQRAEWRLRKRGLVRRWMVAATASVSVGLALFVVALLGDFSNVQRGNFLYFSVGLSLVSGGCLLRVRLAVDAPIESPAARTSRRLNSEA